MLQIILQHWGVETMDYKLDDTESYAEDKCKVYRPSGAEILSIFRKLGLNLIGPYNITDKNLIQNELENKGSKIARTSVREILALIKKCAQFFHAILTKKPCEVPTLKAWREWMGQWSQANFMPKLPELEAI
jgi:hypothetical protein